MDDVVVGALCKRTVDVAERNHALLCHTSREGRGVSFSDADIEGALRHLLLHDVHGATREHGRRDADDARILFRQFHQGVSKHILKFWSRVRTFGSCDFHLRFRVKFAWSVPAQGVSFRASIPLALHRLDVEEFRTLHLFDALENLHEFEDVVSVVGTEIADIHALKDVLLFGEERFHGIVETNQALTP